MHRKPLSTFDCIMIVALLTVLVYVLLIGIIALHP
jgi:hypothetical protein